MDDKLKEARKRLAEFSKLFWSGEVVDEASGLTADDLHAIANAPDQGALPREGLHRFVGFRGKFLAGEPVDEESGLTADHLTTILNNQGKVAFDEVDSDIAEEERRALDAFDPPETNNSWLPRGQRNGD